MKALGTEDPNAVQALVCDAPFPPPVGVLNSLQDRNVLWEAEEAEHSVNAETMLEVIKSLKGDNDPEALQMLATSEAACGGYGNGHRLSSITYLPRINLNVSGIILIILVDYNCIIQTTTTHYTSLYLCASIDLPINNVSKGDPMRYYQRGVPHNGQARSPAPKINLPRPQKLWEVPQNALVLQTVWMCGWQITSVPRKLMSTPTIDTHSNSTL